MSTSIEGTGIEMKPNTLPGNDATKNQALNSAGAAASSDQAAVQGQPNPPQAARTGLPGLAGFARINTFAMPSAPEPVPPPPAEPPAAPMEQQPVEQRPVTDLPPVSGYEPVSEPDLTAFVRQPVEPDLSEFLQRPVEPDPAAFVQQPLEPTPPPVEPVPIEVEPVDTQIPEFIPFQELESDFIAVDVPDLNSLTSPVVPAEDAPELQVEDDLSAFSAEALERYFAGEGDIPGGDTEFLQADAGLGATDFGLDPLEPVAPLEAPEVSDVMTGMQPFEARYDQHPEIDLGDFHEGLTPTGSYQTEAEDLAPSDADFLDGESIEPEATAAKAPKNRKVAMLASALVGSLALGGALAFAYKNSGIIMGGSGDAPLI